MSGEPGPGTKPEQAARQTLEAFLPRAFRRPVKQEEVDRYLALFAASQKRGTTPFEDSILFAMQGALVSPAFLFRVEQPNLSGAVRPLGDFELASRLSYFLWNTMPDVALFDLAGTGRLPEPDILKQHAVRMLKDAKSREFAESFVEQWLGTRELGRDIEPNKTLFPQYYDAELQSAIHYEPTLFFQEMLPST